LPLHYKNMQFFAPLRGDVYSRITRLKEKEQGSEIALFHVELLASDGSLIGEVEEYSLKRVNDGEQLPNNQDQLLPLYEITWTPLDGTTERQTEEIPSAAVLIYSHAQARSPMIQACERRFQRVIHFIVDGETETSHPNYTYVKNCEKDIREALQTLGDLRTYLFVSLLGFSPDSEDLDQGIETKLGFHFRWIKSLSFFPGRKQLRFLTMNATRVDGSEASYNALNQALIGFCSCVESEQSDIDLSVVDADDCSALQTVAEAICQPSGQFVTAIRNNRIYLEQFSPGVTSSNPIEICNDQVILITGGYGGIGLAVAEEIFQMASEAKVVLLNRNAHKGGPYEERVKKLISQGFHIRILQGDVTSEISLAAVLQQIREEYGKISGVIHAAGIAGDGMLVHKEWSSVLKVLLPKIRGAVLLDSLTREDDLEFMLLFSSFTSAVGAPGQTDYAAANAFLDTFTYERNRKGRRTLTVNWTGWKESGMAVNYNVNWQESFAHFVTDQEGRAYFRKLLDSGSPRVIACSFPDGLPSELSRRFLFPTPKVNEETVAVAELVSEVDMPVIYGKSPDKLTDFEKNIALAWARTLRVTEVNLYDKFFEAGGNSLLASYLQKEINRIYPDAMAITDVFVYSTIADIAAYIAGKQKPPVKADDILIPEEGNIEDLVQKFVNGEISLEDIEKLV
ncbi:MAG: SDR family NAD(P)-dependent oxidoreductase, partial [Oscillospiraceae bacterium]|nr:SDR family NAD(P)-dependent oxidoreductase [Oscillospiraceae bacterium]